MFTTFTEGQVHRAVRQAYQFCARQGMFRKGSPKRNIIVKVQGAPVCTCLLYPNRYVDSPDPNAGLHVVEQQDARYPVLEIGVSI